MLPTIEHSSEDESTTIPRAGIYLRTSGVDYDKDGGPEAGYSPSKDVATDAQYFTKER